MKKLFLSFALFFALVSPAFSQNWTVPHAFGSITGTVPLSYLDDNFNALLNAVNTNGSITGTSTTTLILTTGTVTIQTQTGLGFIPNQFLTIFYNTSIYLQGFVTTYSTSTGVLVFDVTNAVGSGGPYSAWTINTTGPAGPTGPQGPSGTQDPIGSVIMWEGSTAPANFILEQGQCLQITSYTALYGVMSTTWNTLDGCTAGYFGLPDRRGTFPIGANVTYAMGTKGGASSYTPSASASSTSSSSSSFSGATGTWTFNSQSTGSLGIASPGGLFAFPINIGIASGLVQAFDGTGGYTGNQLKSNVTVTPSGTVSTSTSTSTTVTPSAMSVMNPWVPINYAVRYQ